MGWSPTSDQILDCDGVYRRMDTWRFDLEDQAGSVIGVLHPDVERPPVITNNTAGNVSRSIDGLFLPADENSAINPLSDRVAPKMVLQNGAEFPMGVMMWTDDSTPEKPWGTEHNSSLGDKMTILNQGIEHSIGFGKGADIGIAALGVALEVLTLDEIEIDPISAQLATGVNHPPQTSRRTILADFMEQIGFLPPHFGHNGKLRLKDVPDFTTVTPSLIYGPGTHVIAGTVVGSNDSLQAPNVFLVYDSSGTSTLVGRYEIAATEPHSEPNRGFFVPISEPRSGMADQATANKAAKGLSVTKGVTYKWKTFATTADPRHDSWDPVSYEADKWLETAWSMPCRNGGIMTHTLRAVY